MDAASPDSPPMAPRGLSEPLLRYLEARGVLLTIEAQEALQYVIRVLIFAAFVAAVAFMGWVLLTAALVHVLMTAMGWHWVKAVTVLGGTHVALAVIFLLVMRNRLGKLRFFRDTLNEFKKDRQWLASQTHQP
jgi:uncharacterized membrane protein YqjE